jgi:serine/threonine protein kinase
MKPEQWQQLDSLFQQACNEPPERRPAFLQRIKDRELRQQLEALLAAHEHAGSFIEAPAFAVEAEWIAGEANDDPLIGRVFGHYRIIEHLGAGGMGEVYRAQDVTLGRHVALKLLPPFFTSDADRLRRFEQEARAASSLNHPNILTIYEIGEADSLRYIATEFIEGATLRDRIAGEAMNIDDALDISLQIVDALIAAHSKGIVHRDIKPENIMICGGRRLSQKGGLVKVLDFGIAKLTDAETINTDLPTRPLVSTTDGMTIGTAAYMSPEQATGEKVDARTDIWSLSAVLYEMISGHPPFEGPTRSHVIVSILEKQPRPLRELVEVPEALEWIVKRGLRKQREERYQTARALYNDLREFRQQLHEKSSEGRLTSELAKQPRKVAGSTRRRKSVISLVLLLAVVALIGLALGVKYWWPKLTARNSVVPFSKYEFMPLTSSGKASSAVISPDGKYVVHVFGSIEQKSLWLRHIATGSDKEIVPSNAGDISNLTFTPDGNRIYFVRGTDSDVVLETVPVLGGPPKQVLHDIDTSATFSPDGQRFAFVRGNPLDATASLILANADGTGEQKLVTRTITDFFFGIAGNPAWSPKSDKIAFALRSADSYRNVFVVGVMDRVEKQITSETWNEIHSLSWLPDESGLLITAIAPERRNTQIFYSSYPDGKVVRITNDLDNYEDMSITADGTSAVTVRSEGNSDIWISSRGDLTNAKKITSNAFDGVGGLDWTPDGKLLHVSNRSGTRDIWLMNADGSEDRQLTANAGLNLLPCASEDGRYVAFASNRAQKAEMQIWRMNIDGTNPTRVIDDINNGPPRCMKGNAILYSSGAESAPTLWKLSLDGGSPTRLTDYYASAGPVSPTDGRIAILFLDRSVTPPRLRTGLVSPEGGPPKEKFDFPFVAGTLGGGFYGQVIRWTADGKSLTYIETKDGVSNLWAQPVNGGPARQLTNFKSDLIFNYAWSRDGKKLALARGSKISDVVLIKNKSR